MIVGHMVDQEEWDRSPAVVVDGLAAGNMVLDIAARRPVRLVSARGMAGLAGAGWWACLQKAWQDRGTGPFLAILDCADVPGHVMSALRAGVTDIAYGAGPGETPALADRIPHLARAYGARIHPPPRALVQPCWRRNRDATLRQWLSQNLDFCGR